MRTQNETIGTRIAGSLLTVATLAAATACTAPDQPAAAPDQPVAATTAGAKLLVVFVADTGAELKIDDPHR